MLIIPFKEMAPDTLYALLEELVTRNGTDYGEIEASVANKVAQVLSRLRTGDACLCYDDTTGSCNVLSADEAKRLMLDSHG